jgi:hypothetical protein
MVVKELEIVLERKGLILEVLQLLLLLLLYYSLL